MNLDNWIEIRQKSIFAQSLPLALFKNPHPDLPTSLPTSSHIVFEKSRDWDCSGEVIFT